MRDEIVDALTVLRGLPLWGSHRVGEIQVFKFGRKVASVTSRGERVEVGEFAIHVSCPWRLVGANGISVGSEDRFTPPGKNPDELLVDWDLDTGNRLDERLGQLFATRTPRVSRVDADDVGGFQLHMQVGLALEVWPSGSYEEYWRLLRPGLPEADDKHFVVTGHGLEKRR